MDVVTLGETMVLLTATKVGPMRFAGQFEKSIGGAESNVAIALARLGHQVGWISRLGRDEFGYYVRHYIRGEGVDTSLVHLDPDYPTGVMFKERQAQDPNIYYYRRYSAASRLSPDDLDEAYLAQARFLHLTGITPALSASCREAVYEAIRLAKKHGVTIVFDPNIRLKLWSIEEARSVLLDIASQSDIVLPGLEEGELLSAETEAEQIARFFLDGGASTVVVKLGAQGAYYATETEAGLVDAYPVRTVVDTVGAGDGFAAGFLSGLLQGLSTSEAVRLGNRIGAYALSVAGDVEGYPFQWQLEQERAMVNR